MTKPVLLLCEPSSERLLGEALAGRFDRLRLWEASDTDALLEARGAEVIAALTTTLDAHAIDRLSNLRLIVVPGAGYENIDVAAARKCGVTVANAGDAHSADVADHAVALTLASIHRLPDMHAWVRDGDWEQAGSPKRRHAMSAQRFGIVGLGNIGTAIAERLAPFGGEIAWWAPHDKEAEWPRRNSLLDLADWCTVLIVASRGDAEGLIDAATIEAVGRDGLIVNITRGSVIDEDALIAALQTGTLGRAALDVFAEEPTPPARWRDVPNVNLSPHVAGVSYESLRRLHDAAVRNLLTVLDGGPVVNRLTDG